MSYYTLRWRLGGEEVQLLLIADLGTRWGWVVSVTPRPCFSPGQRTLGTNCTGDWVGPRAGLDTEATGDLCLCLCRGSNLDRPVVQSVARHYTDTAYMVSCKVQPEDEISAQGGRAMAQAVTRWPLNAEARVRFQVSPCVICGGQSGTGACFSPRSSDFPYLRKQSLFTLRIKWKPCMWSMGRVYTCWMLRNVIYIYIAAIAL
jgi:hypothetical protein